MSKFRQVNANLMRAARLQSATNQAEAAKFFDDFDVSHSRLAKPRNRGAPASAISPIPRQVCRDASFSGRTHHDG